uniref:Uncharacterized protein n=1 Tax=Aegilops tauschii subsp. strangulata TaxID=200361 RepID=A0A453PSY3_AEGTS
VDRARTRTLPRVATDTGRSDRVHAPTTPARPSSFRRAFPLIPLGSSRRESNQIHKPKRTSPKAGPLRLAAMTPRDGAVDLWAMAAELERQFAGYKQRLASSGRISSLVADDDAHVLVLAAAPDDDRVEEEEEEYAAVGGVRGRMYEAYTRRRDERLRSVWRARMERKEAEVMALWAQLDARGGGGPAAAEDVDGAAGEVGNSVTARSADDFLCGRCHDTYVRALPSVVSYLGRPLQS